MIRCAYVFTTGYGHNKCLRVCGGRGVEGGGGLVFMSGPMCVCICHLLDRKIFLASKDKTKVLKF